MAGKRTAARSLRIVAGCDIIDDNIEGAHIVPTGGSGTLSREQVLQYVAHMSEEMHRLVVNKNCAILAYMLEMASQEAEDLLQREAGRKS